MVCVLAVSAVVAFVLLLDRFNQQTNAELLQMADSAEASEDWDTVESSLREYAHRNGESEATLQRIAHAIVRSADDSDDRARAIPFMLRVVALNPDNSQAIVDLSELLADDSPRLALNHLDDLAPALADTPEVVRLRALCLMRLCTSNHQNPSDIAEAYVSATAALSEVSDDVSLVREFLAFVNKYELELIAQLPATRETLHRKAEQFVDRLVRHSNDPMQSRSVRLEYLLTTERAERDTRIAEDVAAISADNPDNLLMQLANMGQTFEHRLEQAPLNDLVADNQSIDVQTVSLGQADSGLFKHRPTNAANEQILSDLEEATSKSESTLGGLALAQLQWHSGRQLEAIRTLQEANSGSLKNSLLLLREAEMEIALEDWKSSRASLDRLIEKWSTSKGGGSNGKVGLLDLEPLITCLDAQWYLCVNNPECDPHRALRRLNELRSERLTAEVDATAAYLQSCAHALNGDWRRAALGFSAITETGPLTEIAHFGTGIAEMQLQRYREAYEHLNATVSGEFKTPSDKLVRPRSIAIARCLLEMERSEHPLRRDWQDFDNHRQLIPESARFNRELSCLDLERGWLSTDQPATATVVNQLTQTDVGLISYCAACIRCNRWDTAQQLLARLQSTLPNDRQLCRLRLNLQLAQADWNSALSTLQTLRENSSSRQISAIVRQEAAILTRLGRIDSASEVLKDQLRRQPNDLQASFQLSQLQFTAGHLTAFEQSIRSHKQIDGEEAKRIALLELQLDVLRLLNKEKGLTYSDVLKDAIAATRKHPREPGLKRIVSWSAEKLGHSKLALDSFRDCLRLTAPSGQDLMRLSYLLAVNDEFTEALSLCLSRNFARPDHQQAILICKLLRHSQPSNAVDRQVMDQILKSSLSVESPLRANFLLEYGRLHEHRGEHDKAIHCLQLALSERPQAVDIQNNLALLLSREKATQPQAGQLIRRAIELAGRQPFLLDSLGVIYLEAGRNEDAVRTLIECVEEEPDASIRLLHLAVALARTDQLAASERYLNRARKIGLNQLGGYDLKLYRDLIKTLQAPS